MQASAAAAWARQLGARTVFLLGDRTAEGDGRTELFRVAAEQGGPRVVGNERADPRADEYKDLAKKVADAKPDAVYFGGGADSNAVRLWRDLHEADPSALLRSRHLGGTRPGPAAQRRVLGGVCAGLGRRFGLNPWLARILFIVILMLIPGSQLIVYPILWILMPRERGYRNW